MASRQELPLPELDLWGSTPIQRSVISDICMDQRPMATLNWNSNIQFEFSLGEDEYMLFSETYLYLKVQPKFAKADKSAIQANEIKTIIPANYLLHSMIESVKLSIGSTSTVYETQNYCYKAYMEALLGYSSEAKKSHLSSSYWIDDPVKRSSKLFDSENKAKTFELKGKLHLDFTHQNRAIVGGTKISLTVTLNKPRYFMEIPKGASASFELLDAVLYVHRMQVAPKIVTAHHKALQNSNAKYPLTRTAVHTQVIPTNSQFLHLDKLLTGQIPRRIFFTLVQSKGFVGDFTTNPYKFGNHNLAYIACFKDGQMVPRNGYNMDYRAGYFVDAYIGFIQTLNQNGTDSYASIDMDTFEKERCIYGFNLTPDLSNGNGFGGYVSEICHGNIRFDLRFTEPTTESLNALIFAEYDTVVEINIERQLITNLVI